MTKKEIKKKAAAIQQSLVVYKGKLQVQVKNWLHLYTVVEGNLPVLAPKVQDREAVNTSKS